MPLTVHLENEYFNGETNQFFTVDHGTFTFEHSLLSLAEWEVKYRKPLLDQKEKSVEEFVDYIMMMELDHKLERNVINDNPDLVQKLSEYIVDVPSATTIKQRNQKRSSSFITSESIYASMAMAQVPYSAESWNLNRLLNVLAIIGEKSNPDKKKRSKREVQAEYKSLNAQRRAAMNGKG